MKLNHYTDVVELLLAVAISLAGVLKLTFVGMLSLNYFYI